MIVITKDGKSFNSSDAKLVGSAPTVCSREITKPAKVGEFPVFVEQSGQYRIFTYSRKIVSIS